MAETVAGINKVHPLTLARRIRLAILGFVAKVRRRDSAGLPLAAEARRAAVASQFADCERQIDALAPPPETGQTATAEAAGSNYPLARNLVPFETDEQRATRLLLAFKADLVTLAMRDDYQTSVHVVITGLLDVAEGLIRRAVRFEPSALPAILSQLDAMRGRILASAQPVETFSGPMH